MSLTSHLSARRYLAVVLIVTFAILLLIIAFAAKALFLQQIFGSQALYQYQLAKIENHALADTVFVGDSSLGNAIDAEYFSELSNRNTLNLALTGNYGYAGSYSMVRKTADMDVQNVIIMQTMDMLKRPVAYEGYLLTLRTWQDIQILGTKDRAGLLSAFFNLVLSPANLMHIVRTYSGAAEKPNRIANDYHVQDKPVDPEKVSAKLNASYNPDKLHFLEMLADYCAENEINLIYAHGPVLSNVRLESSTYLEAANQVIARVVPRLVSEPVLIQDNHIGDNLDHVAPDHKRTYTKKYFEELAELLR